MNISRNKILKDFDLTQDEYKQASKILSAVNKLFTLRSGKRGKIIESGAVAIMVNSAKNTIGNTLICADIERTSI